MIQLRFCVAVPAVLAHLLAAVTAEHRFTGPGMVTTDQDDDVPTSDDDDNWRHPWDGNRGIGLRSNTPPQICTFSGDVAGRCDATAIEASSMDSAATNASTIITSSTNCSEVNCFCAVQYRILPLKPYMHVTPLVNKSAPPTPGTVVVERPAVEDVECPLLTQLYNYMESMTKEAKETGLSHQRAARAVIPICCVDTATQLIDGLEDNVLSLMINGASPIVAEAEHNGFVAKTLFSSKVQIIFNPNKLVNNILFLWDFAIDHLAWNMFFLVLQSLIVGGLMWYIERGRPNSDFPTHWARGLQHGWYWAIITFTTVGFGDDVPRSMYGRIIAVVWAISAVLQTALTTSLLINDLTAYSSASPRELLLNAQPSAVIGALVNTTSLDYASFYSDDGADGVKAFTSVDAACAALQSGDIQGFVADVNMLNMCFIIWNQAGTSFSGFVIAELESARLESYVALFHNASKHVFSAVLNAMEPAEASNNVNVLDNGDATALVASSWSPAANGIVPPQPANQINWTPALVAALGALIGLTITLLAIPLLLCGAGVRKVKADAHKRGWLHESWLAGSAPDVAKPNHAKRHVSHASYSLGGATRMDELSADLLARDDDVAEATSMDADNYMTVDGAADSGSAVAQGNAGATGTGMGVGIRNRRGTSTSAGASGGANRGKGAMLHRLLDAQREELDGLLAKHQEQLDQLVANADARVTSF